MLNLNEVQSSSGDKKDLPLIPDKTIARAMINIQGGEVEMPEFGQGLLFKKSASGAAWFELELTIMGGEYDGRRVWHRVFVDGAKINPDTGVPVAREIGLGTLRQMVDSMNGLRSDDMSPEACAKRQISSILDLQGKEFCFLIGIEPEQNGYPAKNKMIVPLAADDKRYLSGGASAMPNGAAVAPAPTAGVIQPAATAPAVTATAGVVPAWAQK